MTRFVGIPYLRGGRDFSGCDCFGLLKLYYAEVLHIELPDVCDAEIARIAELFEKIDTLRALSTAFRMTEGDVITFDFNGERHVGVAVSSTRFLHNLNCAGSVISRISDYKLFVTGVYRYAHISD